MSEPKPRQMMTCPYNMAHQVEQYRMHIHLQKCRKQYPNEAVSICPFDATHIIRDVEMDVSTIASDNEPSLPVTEATSIHSFDSHTSHWWADRHEVRHKSLLTGS